MSIPDKMISHHELAEFTYKYLVDDRHDFVIETLNNMVDSKESTIEDKVLALEKLSDIFWSCIGDYEKALEYIEMALKLAEETSSKFNYILRGTIWESKLYILKLLGRYEAIEKESESIIARFASSTYISNSYLYSTYKYKAKTEFSKKNYETAYEFLLKAKQYHPINFCTSFESEVEVSNFKKCYDSLAFLLARNVTEISIWDI